ncbi:MAG: tRNA uridine-5-carboxymethylaminomethyl(34) synthesis GTPase MnmE [Gammaproteobacteria bacterium]|nr:tRNA uridine-5-carboxymethylaminomethyl(34) synthesis GTPase MnmE [Gammaproteobacteria bacterium]MCF6260588.1 tRNA uridine-5-carboxymethylaminomethyl(34) synthesis GTPase MnmE [Gammaproteobacteria bacterium]
MTTVNTAGSDTIAALATPPGRGGVGIIRLSGSGTRNIAHQLLGHVPAARQAEYLPFCADDGEPLDTGLALYFPAPHSFTGEDVLELHGHGGPVVMDLLLQRCLSLGARPARPGEFSERAFLNNKMDLAQAEAVADLIDSASAQAARLAVRSLQGAFSQRIHALVEALTELRIYVESAIDFPEEEIDFLGDGQVQTRLTAVMNTLAETRAAARQGNLLREGMTVVIAGRPNAGKSTLLNALAGRDTAIVTDIPGTTRDILREHIQLDGLPLHIIDTAGLRDSDDAVEQEGIRRAWTEIEGADRILLLHDASQSFDEQEQDLLAQLGQAGPPITLVQNKIDLLTVGIVPVMLPENAKNITEIAVSARSGTGLQTLREHLKACVGYEASGEGQFMARRRHLQALDSAQQHLENGQQQLQHHAAGELLAEDLRQAQLALGEITGEVSADELLGKIFSSFCIGK